LTFYLGPPALSLPEADRYILKIRPVIPPTIRWGFQAPELWAMNYQLWTGIADAPFILLPEGVPEITFFLGSPNRLAWPDLRLSAFFPMQHSKSTRSTT